MRDLVAIEEAAGARSLPFLLAGGHAVIAHGHGRMTFDLDLIVRREDAPEWCAVVLALGYVLYNEQPTFLQFSESPTAAFPLDLMMVPADTFQKLEAASVPLPLPGTRSRMVSLLHLIALKCHAIKHGRDERKVKDTDDLIHLIRNNRLDLQAPDLCATLLKHGDEELYGKLQRACQID